MLFVRTLVRDRARAKLELDRREQTDREAVCDGGVPQAEWSSLSAATLGAAAALQEAIAFVDFMRLRTGAGPSPSDLQALADRLARADAAFRIVAIGNLKTVARKPA